MTIKRIDFFDFIFNGGRGIRTDQVDWSVSDADLSALLAGLGGGGGSGNITFVRTTVPADAFGSNGDVAIVRISATEIRGYEKSAGTWALQWTSGLPSGSDARRALRWNDTNSSWEAFSSESTLYYALTTTESAMTPIRDVIIDALTNGFNDSIRGQRRNTHYNSSVGEIVLGRQYLPYYNVNGAAGASWEGDAARGRADSIAAFAAFSVSPLYSWIILPADTNGAILANRYWNVVPRDGTSSEPPGVITNTPAFTRVNQDLIINDVTFHAARARIEWETGTTIHNFELTFNPQQDAPTAVWQTP